MTVGKDTFPVPTVDADAEMLRNVMKATGLPQEAVEAMLADDSDLDALCDNVLSEFATPKKVAITKA